MGSRTHPIRVTEPAPSERDCANRGARKLLLPKERLVEAAGVELITVLTARKLLILGIATTAKKPSLPDPLYVHCTKISSSFSAPTSITGRVSHSFALLRKTICSL
jgi:hypothetical protein